MERVKNKWFLKLR